MSRFRNADSGMSPTGSGFRVPGSGFFNLQPTAYRLPPASAIILAGGRSLRMGQDKALLPFMGRPMIEHILLQLQPHFSQVLISANDVRKFAFLGVPVIPDKSPGQGPLMGIASSLDASAHDLNFVVACDTPGIDMLFVRRMLRRATDSDCVVPVNAEGLPEPLFAIYHKNIVDIMWSLLAEDQRKISAVFSRCRTTRVSLPRTQHLENVNTAESYEALLSSVK